MNELTTKDVATNDVTTPTSPTSTRPQTPPTGVTPEQQVITEQQVISEQEVRFGTAAAGALSPARTRGLTDIVHRLATRLRAAFKGSDLPPAKRHHPKRYTFLENAAMARAMERL